MVHHVLCGRCRCPSSERILADEQPVPGAGASDTLEPGVPDYYDRLRATSVSDEQAFFNTGSGASTKTAGLCASRS